MRDNRNTSKRLQSARIRLVCAIIGYLCFAVGLLPSAYAGTLRIEETEIRLFGLWVIEDDPEYGYSGGVAAVANWIDFDPGAYATFEFYGTGITWIGARTFNGGLFDWIIDEGTVNERSGTVNTYIDGVERVTSELLADDLEFGHHTFKFISLGIHGDTLEAQLPSETYIDAFDILSAESMPFTINPGLSGAWYNPDTSGQGQLIDIEPVTQSMFLSWFTFTDAASGNPNEQQWYTAQGNYNGATAVLDLYETLGGKFDDPQGVSTTKVGEAALSFSDCNHGQMTYSFDGEELQGEFPLLRAIPGSGNVCEGLNGMVPQAVDINDGMDGAWFDPITSGQGYLIDAHPDPEGGNFIFVAWFTYGQDTASGQRWLTAQGSFEGSIAEIDVFESNGGSFNDPLPPRTTLVGTMSIDFTDCSNAQLSYSLPTDPAEGDVAITRVIPGGQELCEELTGLD